MRPQASLGAWPARPRMRSSPGSVSKFQAKGQIERTARLEKFGPARFAEKSGGVGGLLCRQRTPFVIAYVLPIRNPACPPRRVDGGAAAFGRLTKVESSPLGAAQRLLSPSASRCRVQRSAHPVAQAQTGLPWDQRLNECAIEV